VLAYTRDEDAQLAAAAACLVVGTDAEDAAALLIPSRRQRTAALDSLPALDCRRVLLTKIHTG